MENGPRPELRPEHPIPPLSKKWIDLIGPDYSDPTQESWKYNFYFRHVEMAIPVLINDDFENENNLAQLNDVKNFIARWQREILTQEDQLLSVSRALNTSFQTLIEDQSGLPGIVTSRFSIPSEKASAKKAYQNLLLVEMTYFIERKLREEPVSQETEALQQWVRQKQSELKPSFLTLHFNKIRFALFGDSFAIAYGWIKETLPLSLQAHFMHLVKAARNLPHFNHSIKQNLKTMGHGILQSLYVPLGIGVSIFMQSFSFFNRLTSLPFEGLQRLFQHHARIQRALFILQTFKSLVLTGLLIAHITPFVVSFAIYSAYAYIGAILSNPFLRAIDFCLRSIGYNSGYIQNEIPLMSYQTTVSIGISSFFPSFTFNRINEAMEQLQFIFEGVGTFFNDFSANNWSMNEDLQHRLDAWILRLNDIPNTILPIEQPLGTLISQIIQQIREEAENEEEVAENDPELAAAIAASLEVPRPLTPLADARQQSAPPAENNVNDEDDIHVRRTRAAETAEARRLQPQP